MLFSRLLPLLWLLSGAAVGGEEAYFETHVRPLLVTHCYECHSAEEGSKIKGGLRLDHREGWQVGGDSGPALVPGDAKGSLLLKAVRYRDPDLQMPPKKKLAKADIAVLERWVLEGAFDPRESTNPSPATPAVKRDLEAERAFWSFQKPQPPTVPKPRTKAWARAPLDAFLLDQWEHRGASPAPETSQASLTRRLTDTLTGLPPAALDYPMEDRPDARGRLADRLLASPRYGERWGRHWLDVARYADSNGMDENKAYPDAWRYRDYVIDAFNADMPFDQFAVEQLAGDLLPDSGISHKVATGFLSVGPKMLACDDPVKMRMDIVDEQVDTTGRAFLGMTFGCARCHDHKFDPVSIEDYYGLAGIFKSTKTLVNYNVVAQWHTYDLSPEDVKQAHREIEKLRKQSKNKKLDEDAREKAKDTLESLEAKTAAQTLVMAVTEDEVADVPVHLRGNYQTLGKSTPRQIPEVFHGAAVPKPGDKQSGRLELAQWIGSADNPLTARVLANRLWRWHFGKGIVTSTDNFGKLGASPRHTALLDHLAHELIRGDWSIKRMQRLIVTSARYGMRSSGGRESSEIDPNQVMPSHHERQRLSAESLRDALLAFADQLDLNMGGQLLKDKRGAYVNRSRLNDYLEIPRRAVYMPIVRSALYDAFVAFDMADPSAPNGDRRDSVVAPQSLYMMNSELVHQAAANLAATHPHGSDAERLNDLYQKLLNRRATPDDLSRTKKFIQYYAKDDAWAAFVRVILASNEFLYLD